MRLLCLTCILMPAFPRVLLTNSHRNSHRHESVLRSWQMKVQPSLLTSLASQEVTYRVARSSRQHILRKHSSQGLVIAKTAHATHPRPMQLQEAGIAAGDVHDFSATRFPRLHRPCFSGNQ